MTTLHTGAITSAILSGACALVALVVGSPLEFGVALAFCGAAWVAADFIERTVERERAARQRAVFAPSAPRWDPISRLNIDVRARIDLTSLRQRA
jgi:hypothetical protein